MKQNLVVLLADMFNLFEIHPAPCVDYPESEQASGEFFLINFFSRVNCGLCHFKKIFTIDPLTIRFLPKSFCTKFKKKKSLEYVCLKIGEDIFFSGCMTRKKKCRMS